MNVQITNAAAAVRAARAIESLIASSGWEPGHLIGRRQELAKQFGVAPATLSEAIQLLRSRGVVAPKPGPGGGIFVSSRWPFARLSDQLLSLREDTATVGDCLRVLDALDGAILHDAVQFADEGDLADVALCAETLREAWSGPDAASAIWALHSRIARISTNKLLQSLYINLVEYIVDHEMEGATAPDTGQRLQIHLDFAKSVTHRDHALAASAIERHRGRSATSTWSPSRPDPRAELTGFISNT